MTYLRFLRHVWAVVTGQDCHMCGGGGTHPGGKQCGVCNGSGSCPGGR
ncbi:hypothetical protein ACH35V_40795 [Actinomadura sp. 1N219]